MDRGRAPTHASQVHCFAPGPSCMGPLGSGLLGACLLFHVMTHGQGWAGGSIVGWDKVGPHLCPSPFLPCPGWRPLSIANPQASEDAAAGEMARAQAGGA